MKIIPGRAGVAPGRGGNFSRHVARSAEIASAGGETAQTPGGGHAHAHPSTCRRSCAHHGHCRRATRLTCCAAPGRHPAWAMRTRARERELTPCARGRNGESSGRGLLRSACKAHTAHVQRRFFIIHDLFPQKFSLRALRARSFPPAGGNLYLIHIVGAATRASRRSSCN